MINPLLFSSCFSFNYGCIHPAKMAHQLSLTGISCLPFTDVLSTAGITSAIEAAEKYKLRLLYGQCIPGNNFKITLYPDDSHGFCWLNRLCSRLLAHNCQKSFVQPDILKLLPDCLPEGEGRILLSGPLLKGIIEIFLTSNWHCYFTEPATMARQAKNALTDLALHYNVPIIAAPEIRTLSREDGPALRLLKAIDAGSLLEDIPMTEIYSLKDFLGSSRHRDKEVAAMNRSFAAQPSWVPSLGQMAMPKFCKTTKEAISTLRKISFAGLKKKYKSLNDCVMARFDYELHTINELGFADYFLTVNEISQQAKKMGTRLLGRGSAANSLISYALDLTQVDPIKHNLYFERFLNPQRKSPPDIDLDFSWKIRDDIYSFLRQRWGAEKVALVSTHITMNSKRAIRETGKALGIPSEELGYLSSLIGHAAINDFLREPLKLARFKPDMNRLKQHKQFLQLAGKVVGLPTHFSIHAGGVIIAPKSIFNYTITQSSSKTLPITHLEMRACESLGLVKIDLLSQRALGVYAEAAQKLAMQNQTIPASPAAFDKDASLVNALSSGKTMGVFYIESPGMRGLLAKLHCKNFEELTAASSIIRPGVAESGMMQEYISRHLQKKDWKPIHPALEKVLKSTYGIMVYQEDVMKVAHELAGFSLADADVLRRAMSGKERSSLQMQAARQKFLEGTAGNKIGAEIAKEVWRQISSFCGYAFCKAHSASYAVLSLQLLWLKIKHPAIFIAAVLNNRGGFYPTSAYISEAQRLGLKILPPDVNKSEIDFAGNETTLLTGLSFIASLKRSTISRIINERQKTKFIDINDFLQRVAPDDTEWENLVNSGSLAGFGSQVSCRWARKLTANSGLFAAGVMGLPAQLEQHEPRNLLIKNELKSLGFAVSGHPTELFRQAKDRISSYDLNQHVKQRVTVCGLLIAAKSVTTASGARMKFLTLEDPDGLIEVVFFPADWQRNMINLEGAAVLQVEGFVQSEDGTLSILGKKLQLSDEKKL
jgi:DNA-directed DNA polymerase III PolC